MNASFPMMKNRLKKNAGPKMVHALVGISILLGGFLRLVEADWAVQMAANQGFMLPTASPIEEAPLRQEAPTETSSSPELPKDEEETAISFARFGKRQRQVFPSGCQVQPFRSRNIHQVCRSSSAQFEHCFRNGCGSPLRC